MNIVVFAGGVSRERPVSYVSGREVALALERNGHTVTVVDPALGADGVVSDVQSMGVSIPPLPEDNALPRYLEALQLPVVQQADIVFVALHGRYGEDGTVQALLEIAGIPYTGSGVSSSAAAMDKVLSRQIFDGVGIPQPPWCSVTAQDAEDPQRLEHLRTIYGNDLVVKPSDEGSSFGITIIRDGNTAALQQAIRFAAQFSETVLVERYIPGRELTVAIVEGLDPLPVVEIVPKNGFYDYEHKYQKGKTEYLCPAPLEETAVQTLQRLAQRAHQALGCEVFSRVDFRMDEQGLFFCLEVNTIPGLTPLSLLPKAAAAAGISFEQLCQILIERSMERFRRRFDGSQS